MPITSLIVYPGAKGTLMAGEIRARGRQLQFLASAGGSSALTRCCALRYEAPARLIICPRVCEYPRAGNRYARYTRIESTSGRVLRTRVVD
jgi:hypothetical protein